ncbi:unnamed protein product [Prorocentrum cordatum]|uniref:PBP domain-containing protein n=1 Tax=Prorocentrum cordatum TaxID=2364126 RepID=A0ABN9WTY6_9DINO|nr:unnamed protein product [Polarella glacialis]
MHVFRRPERVAAALAATAGGLLTEVGAIEHLVSGSSTALPIVARWAQWFRGPDVGIVEPDLAEAFIDHKNLGSSTGARRLCNGEVDIGTMSRDWHTDEATLIMRRPAGPALYRCAGEAGITVGQLPIAWDGIAVFMRTGSPVQHCLRHIGTPVSMEQIDWIFTRSEGEGGACRRWKDLPGNDGSPQCADACIERWVPGKKSGTLEVFEKAFNHTLDTFNQQLYNASEDDNDIIQGVLGSEYAIGFVGYNYYQNSSGLLSMVPLVNHIEEAFCMMTAERHYPFARQLFMNVNVAASVMAWDLINFGFGDRGQHLVGDAGACRMSDSSVQEAQRFITSHFDPADFEEEEAESTFEVLYFWVTGLLVVGCLFGVCMAKIMSLERVRRKMPLCFRKADALVPLMRDLRTGNTSEDIIVERPYDDPYAEDCRADPNMQLSNMLNACGAEIGGYLSWADVRDLWAASPGLGAKLERQSSVNSDALLDSLMEEVWSAMDSESPAGRALQYWFMQAPSLQWSLTISGEAVVALLWALGALARPAVMGWHSEVAALIMQRRAGCWVNQQLVRAPGDTLSRFVVGGRLPELATYVRWAYGGNHLDLRAADLIPLLMDLDPTTTAHLPVPPTPAQALRCAQGLCALVVVDGQYYCFPHSAWERRCRSDLRPFSELATAAGPLSEARSSPPPSVLGDGASNPSDPSSAFGQSAPRSPLGRPPCSDPVPPETDTHPASMGAGEASGCAQTAPTRVVVPCWPPAGAPEQPQLATGPPSRLRSPHLCTRVVGGGSGSATPAVEYRVRWAPTTPAEARATTRSEWPKSRSGLAEGERRVWS